MRAVLGFLLLLRCVWAHDSKQSFPLVFSRGTQLLVEGSAPSGPEVHIFLSAPAPRDPAGSRLLLCLLSGFNGSLPSVVWWLDGTAVAPPEAEALWAGPGAGGAYTVLSVWRLPAARGSSSVWCGAEQDGTVHRRRADTVCGAR